MNIVKNKNYNIWTYCIFFLILTSLNLQSAATIMPEARGDKKEALLINAMKKGDLLLIKKLIQGGMDIDKPYPYLRLYPRNPAHFTQPLLSIAAFCGHKPIVEYLINARANVNARDKFKATPLLDAAYENRSEIVELLMNNGADINATDTNDVSPIVGAITQGHDNVIALLLHSHINYERFIIKKYTKTPIAIAIERNYPNIVKLLKKPREATIELIREELIDATKLNKNIINIINDYSSECYANGIAKHRVKIIEELHKTNVLPSALCLLIDSFNHRATLEDDLFFAVKIGDTFEIEKLIKLKVHVNTVDASGMTALMHASMLGYEKIVELLINAGANVNAIDYSGYSSLIYASIKGHKEIVSMLLKSKADMNIRSKSMRLSAIAYAINAGNIDVAYLLLNNGANIDSVLPILVYKQYDLPIFIRFLTMGANINAKDDQHGNTALMWAIYNNNVEFVNFLLNSGADLKITNKYGEKAIDIASKHDCIEIIKLLNKK